MYRDDRVWVANAGDSRAVLGTEMKESSAEGSSIGVETSGLVSVRDFPGLCCSALGRIGADCFTAARFLQVAVALSDDHNPDRPGELERIESCGGFVSPPPEEGLSARVWLDREMTRIGLVRNACGYVVRNGLVRNGHHAEYALPKYQSHVFGVCAPVALMFVV